MSCLFSRKLDLIRTHNLLQANWKWRKDNNFVTIPKYAEIPREIWKLSTYVVGARTKNGCGLVYYQVKDFEINKEPFTIPNMMKLIVWYYTVGIFCEGMDYFRNGVEMVEDLEGFGWKHFDVDFQKKMGSAFTDTFPLRIKKVHVMNPPSIFDAIMKIAKTFSKSKMMDRIEIISKKSDILKFVEKDNLLDHFGGNLSYDNDKALLFITEWVKENEERLINPGKQTQ